MTPKTFLARLKKQYSDEKSDLFWDKNRPWTLLFAVILSARATDKKVNEITPCLFKKFPKLEDFAVAPLEETQRIIRPIGFFREKAARLQKSAQILLRDHAGILPGTMSELILLPGVGRKTANVVLRNAFEKNEGIAVDTHVSRVSERVGLVPSGLLPEKIEQILMKKFPKIEWGAISHRVILFGRDFCRSGNPKCEICPLRDSCRAKMSRK